MACCFRCHDCPFTDPDPEAVIDHMRRRDCQRRPEPAGRVPEWVRRAREGQLPSRVTLPVVPR